MDYLPPLEYETAPAPTASVIWLHGLGSDGNDFRPIVPELGLPETLGIRFIFPHAPSMPVTVNNGFVMPAWYDIMEMNIDRKVDVKQLEASADYITGLIDKEIERGISSERIVIAGFSQGGAVAYQTALSYHKPLAGLLTMSTYFATADSIERHEANNKLPVRIFHGTVDDVVPESLGQKANKTLTEMGYTPKYLTYPMAHTVTLEEINDISAYLQEWLLP
uniref:Phospholipase/carboxylesterase family protein n=1 Tax=uncultured Thiotrichaceae bacterium TaxID=298394 RepID=A0A6S6SL91_9GAMM|nr:MAG: phospholipase/carboxylesterase family protein [uncultured Thiotrichaceae bacterium]